jgi:short-subunit dehydrogenase
MENPLISYLHDHLAGAHLLPYTASKFALVGHSEGLRAELAKYNVYVTTVCPGLMRTGSPPNADFIGQPEKEYAWFAISDSLPVATIGAETAARKIIEACVHGDAEIHLGATAKLGALAQGCAPSLTADMLSVVNHFMPDALPGRPARKKGAQGESQVTESAATVPMRKAASANNQL